MIDLCLALLPIFALEGKAFPDIHHSIFVGQVWAESKCKAKAELKTEREYGFGLSQCTVTARFNCWEEMRAAHREALKDWTWQNRFDPALNIRVVVLKDRGDWNATLGTANRYERTAFMLAAYNGGRGGIKKDRLLCGNTPACNPAYWFGHTELTSYKTRVKWTGYGQSAFEINRAYPKKIIERAKRYV